MAINYPCCRAPKSRRAEARSRPFCVLEITAVHALCAELPEWRGLCHPQTRRKNWLGAPSLRKKTAREEDSRVTLHADGYVWARRLSLRVSA